MKFCSRQLGHADETTVRRIYGKLNIEERERMIQLCEAREAGRRAAVSGQ